FSTENPAPPPIDPAMEQQAYADLLAFAAQYDEGDADTIIEALNMDEFLEEDFEPGLADLDSLDILEG
ncbi:MAG: hypothetical protein KDJ66_06365, partial [Nitratireductor sp.]|nr:hypothetical protein [Nitratireductor sp.]